MKCRTIYSIIIVIVIQKSRWSSIYSMTFARYAYRAGMEPRRTTLHPSKIHPLPPLTQIISYLMPSIYFQLFLWPLPLNCVQCSLCLLQKTGGTSYDHPWWSPSSISKGRPERNRLHGVYLRGKYSDRHPYKSPRRPRRTRHRHRAGFCLLWMGLLPSLCHSLRVLLHEPLDGKEKVTRD